MNHKPGNVLPKFIFALLGAAAGLTLALATSDSSQSSIRATAAPRAVGTPLRFTNPFLLAGTDPAFPKGGNTSADPQGFDLGDACGTGPFTRVITAAGGYQPYTFVTQALFDKFNLGNNAAPQSAIPPITPIGKLSGALSIPFGTVLRFNIVLTDFIATQRIGTFHINFVPCPGPFRFAIDRLPTAQLGNHFYADLETNNGVAPITYRVLPGSVNTIGKSFPTLEDAGLTLSPDGILIGRPVVSGALNFTIQATDATGAVALARSGTSANQAFALTVEANTQANSELISTQIALNGHTSGGGKDVFTLQGYLDPRNETVGTLAGSTLTLRIGPTAFSGTFNAKGKVSAVLPNKGKFSVSYQPSSGGRLKIKLSNVDLATPLGASAFANKTNRNLIVGLELVSFRTSDLLNVTTSVSSGKFALNYGLGRRGVPVSGGFQILSVFGKDGQTGGRTPLAKAPKPAPAPKPPKPPKVVGPDGSAWKVIFLAVPRVGIDGGKSATSVLDGGGSATVRIGQSFSQQVSLTKQNVKLEFKAGGKDPGVFRLFLNPKTFYHTLQTNVLAESDTAISPAINTKDLTVFPLGLDITGYSGQTGRVIAPNVDNWRGR
jgi:hypothetical protein